MTALPPDDDDLLRRLAEALREAEEVPPWVRASGRDALAWLDVDAELAEVTRRPHETAGSRAGSVDTPWLTFETGAVTIELEATPTGLLGQLVPPGADLLELDEPDAVRALAVDDAGAFRVYPAPAGLFRLRARLAGGQVVRTSWTRV